MSETTETQRRSDALKTAFQLFVRYGYRKTSMHEIATSIGISRQGLYLWFPKKETLFVATLDNIIAGLTECVGKAFANSEQSATERIVDAFDAYTGSFVATGISPMAMDELLEETAALVGDRFTTFEQGFISRVAEELAPFAGDAGTAQDLATVLHSASVGLKHQVSSRPEYRDRMAAAVRAICRE